MRELQAIEFNRDAHDRVASTYDSAHLEIYNPVEQARLARSVREAVIVAGGSGIRALDVGAGTGNLSAHLLACGAAVTSADLSPQSLAVLRQKLPDAKTVLLDGRGLRAFADGSFALVACYSVLHHVPDYLALVREMARVTRKGGVLYLDHERTDESWKSAERAQFLALAAPRPRLSWTRFLNPATYWRRANRALWPRWMPEGDLHVWEDDHIEWARIEQALGDCGVKAHLVRDVLLYDPRYTPGVWEQWKDRITDYRTFTGRKI
ncbi:MAG: class I SAM-dependent methyltransferase [Planctomycetes bacterium]|nr:class I SAM-dependent methyltransferase [Planctomycetota bacterium]